jgi:hypothetical protein
MKISMGGGVAFLWATLPPLFIDRLITHHTRYPYPREYPGAFYFIVPLVILVVLGTYLWMRRRETVWAGLVPFAVAVTAATPIFRPEFPHGQILHAGGLWFILAGLTLWIRMFEHGAKPVSKSNLRKVDKTAYIEYLKEQVQYWRNLQLVIVGGYIALVISWANFVIQYSKDMVGGNQSEAFVLNTLAISGIALCSFGVLVYPVSEASKRHRKALHSFLSIRDTEEPE